MAPVKPKNPAGMTDAEIEGYARRFEESRPEDWKPGKKGRPPLGDDYPSPRIQVRVPSPLYRAVNERAHDEGTTVSALVRRLLEGYAGSKREG